MQKNNLMSMFNSRTATGGQQIKMAIASFLLAISGWFEKIAGMNHSTESDELLSYVPKQDKIVEGALLLLEKAAEAGQALTACKLITAMFLADKGHLDAYGRPVFFDNYIATRSGPEGVAATQMLDSNYDWSSSGEATSPWTIEHKDDLIVVRSSRAPNMRRLSETDVEALESALAIVSNLDREQLRLFTHRDQAFLAAWNDGKGVGSRLDPRLIPDSRDDEMIDDLLYASRHAFVAPSR
ncbi:MAG: type II toxin-antitoxin system antitoxin SocA domain-containing protein [Qipengyuania pacifica]